MTEEDYRTLKAILRNYPTKWYNLKTGLPLDAKPSEQEISSGEYAEFPKIIPYLREHPETVREYSEKLERCGIIKIKPNKYGSFALIAETVDHQLARLSLIDQKRNPNESSLPNNLWEILQPVKTFTMQDKHCTLEILPRVEVQDKHMGVKSTLKRMRDIFALQISLAKKGYFFFDAWQENVGYTKNGTPVILDKGAVVPISQANEVCWNNFCRALGQKKLLREKVDAGVLKIKSSPDIPGNLIKWIEKFMPVFYDQMTKDTLARKMSQYDPLTALIVGGIIDDAYLGSLTKLPTYDYEAAQKDHLKELGLQSNKVVGTRSGQLARYLDEEPGEGKKPLGSTVARMRLARNLEIKNPGEFVAAAKESGGYDKVTAERLRKSRKPVPGFLDRVTQQNDEPKER